MKVFRIVANKARTADLSGTGAFQYGGRWNSKGTYMLYTSENSSLAYLETLAHFDESLAPSSLYIMEIEIRDNAPIREVQPDEYPLNWTTVGLLENQLLGDSWMKDLSFLAVRVRSAVNTKEYNYLLNPLHPSYRQYVRLIGSIQITVDSRLTI